MILYINVVYGTQCPPFRFRTAGFRGKTVVLPQSSIRVNSKRVKVGINAPLTVSAK